MTTAAKGEIMPKAKRSLMGKHPHRRSARPPAPPRPPLRCSAAASKPTVSSTAAGGCHPPPIVISGSTMRKTTVSSLNPSFHLPEDVIIEILSRLPVKSLIRFTVVCKSWNSLIENPNFISKHFKQNPSPGFNYLINSNDFKQNRYCHYVTSLHFENGFHRPINLDFPFMIEKENVSIVGVCNGLVCVSLSLYRFDIVICNPSTRRFSKISNFDDLEAGCSIIKVAYGFFFDSCCDDYKFIIIACYVAKIGRKKKACVYTMSTDSWRETDIDVPIDENLRVRQRGASALINSVFYWECEKFPLHDPVFLCFNMIDESFRVISAVEGFNELRDYQYWKSVQLKEELTIFAYTFERRFDVWTLNADSVCLNLRYSIGTLPEVAKPGLPFIIRDIGDIKLLGCGKDGDVIFEDRTNGDVKLFSYDLESGEIKILPFGEVGYDYDQVIGYTESLIPVKKNNQV